MNLFFFCQENAEFGRRHVLEGAKHCPNGFVPQSASTYSPWSSQLRTPRWIQRRPRCARPQSWRTPAWPPRTWETRTYRWQPCPLSVSHISSGCWQDGKSAPEVPCRHRSNIVRWLHRTKKKKRMDLNQTRHYDSLWTSSPWQYNAHQFLHLKEEQPRVWSEPDCSCHWEKKKSGAESHICCSHCLWEAPAWLSLLG